MTPSLQRVCRYIGIQEKEFEWLTEQLVSLANKYCKGRIVSALEGGYRTQGGIVSAFARSVASHVRALSAPSKAEWSWADVQAEQQRERQRKVLMLCSCKLHPCWFDMQTWLWVCAQVPQLGCIQHFSPRLQFQDLLVTYPGVVISLQES